MSTEGTAWPSAEGVRSQQGFSSPWLSSDPGLQGETETPSRSHQAPSMVTVRLLGSMELWLANTFLPLLLLTWLPTGESPICLCLQKVWKVPATAFTSPLASFSPSSAALLCHVPCKGVHLATVHAQAVSSRGFEPALPSAAGRENNWGEGNRNAYNPD